ncbi:MAG: DUF881 domain-containing protein [Intrasporangium sp.]|uniref:DUF881 domain-containing protein n=1 Tax=Intrasporangium sp. TaxID=1925024 RepID=UPI00264762D5|nr:DUF881 domain-containing protein [Intrasporangium sp.]MDN5797277.1 DUF881 domain-containing protein [Intrasporangium sp.]
MQTAAPDDAVPTGRHALPRRRWRVWTLLVPGVTAIAGLMFAMSFHAAQGSDLRADRDLPQLIIEANDHVATTAAQIDDLQREVDRLSSDAAPRDERLEALTQEADALAVEAGSTPVTGPALAVTLTDSKVSLDSLPDEFTADDVIVHQQDVQAVVNALWAGGAEAMMIQDQRVISTSAVRCVGNTLILQGRVYSPPYVITAMGDTTRMEQTLAADPTIQIYQQYVVAVGLGWEVAVEPDATFPAYSGAVDLSRAEVIR